MTNAPSGYQLWMGGLEHYMTENFIMNAFLKMGEKPIAIKVMRSRYTGEPAGYGFIHFNSEEEAKSVIHKLNGKLIPNAAPGFLFQPVRFRLNMATNSANKIAHPEREYSLFVGELSSDVDDHLLYKTFASRYQSLHLASVAKDSLGFCKGYGFLRFRSEEDLKHCLAHMNGFKGLGSKPIKVSVPLSKSQKMPNSVPGGYSSSQDYSNSDSKSDLKTETKNQEMSYWQSYSAWQFYDESDSFTHKLPPEVFPQGVDLAIPVEDELELIEHNTKVDIDCSNRELTQRDYNLWDALECSKWMPIECFD